MKEAMDRRARHLRALLLAMSIFLFGQSAQALNGYIYVMPCANCSTSAEFVSAAVGRATSQARTGLYAVMSQNFDRTAYVQVAGTIKTRIRDGQVEIVSVDLHGTSIDPGGSAITADTQLDQIDQVVFGVKRSNAIIVNVSSDYAASFINGLDGEIAPGIGNGLLAMGINPAFIDPGTVITAKFSDGTTAQYVKMSPLDTYQWTWNGVAHNAQGKRINRDGTLVGNPNSGGAGGGEARSTRGANTFRLMGSSQCGAAGSISDSNNVVLLNYTYNYLPC